MFSAKGCGGSCEGSGVGKGIDFQMVVERQGGRLLMANQDLAKKEKTWITGHIIPPAAGCIRVCGGEADFLEEWNSDASSTVFLGSGKDHLGFDCHEPLMEHVLD